jgi:hypothetical protein
MGLLDDAIREHLELKRKRGAAEEEVAAQEAEALSPVRRSGEYADAAPAAAPDEPEVAEPDAPPEEPSAVVHEVEEPPAPALEPEPEPAPAPPEAEPPARSRPAFASDEPWLDEPDEVPAAEALEHEPAAEDVLEETPEFLQETPEHDRLWFEQKPPRDFDFDR